MSRREYGVYMKDIKQVLWGQLVIIVGLISFITSIEGKKMGDVCMNEVW